MSIYEMTVGAFRSKDSYDTTVKMMKCAAKRMLADISFVAVYERAKVIDIAFFHNGKVVEITQPKAKNCAVKKSAAYYAAMYKGNNK